MTDCLDMLSTVFPAASAQLMWGQVVSWWFSACALAQPGCSSFGVRTAKKAADMDARTCGLIASTQPLFMCYDWRVLVDVKGENDGVGKNSWSKYVHLTRETESDVRAHLHKRIKASKGHQDSTFTPSRTHFLSYDLSANSLTRCSDVGWYQIFSCEAVRMERGARVRPAFLA